MAAGLSDRVRGLVRPTVADLEPYDPGFAPVAVNLSANENTHGMPPAVRQAVDQAVAALTLNRYPDPLSRDLRAELAAWHGVAPEQVLVANGGDEALFNLFLAYGGAGHVLVNCPPTFGVYRLYAQMVETPVVDVPRDPQSLLPDVDALVEAASTATLVVVTSPNNPTGDLFPREGVERLCAACPGIVVVDEAYMEFAPGGSSCEDLLQSHPNLVVLHTLSKAFCFAGGRIGYLLGDADVLAALSAVRQPYSVNVLSQAAALAIVRRRDEFLPAVEDIRAQRERLFQALRAWSGRGVTVWPSSANFLCVRVPQARRTWERLRDEHGILVRNFSATPGLEGCLRVTVGTQEENDRVLAALDQLLPDRAPGEEGGLS